MTSGSEPVQTIRATERFGFFETAEAMRTIIGSFGTDMSVALGNASMQEPEPSPAAGSSFMQFRRKFNPFV